MPALRARCSPAPAPRSRKPHPAARRALLRLQAVAALSLPSGGGGVGDKAEEEAAVVPHVAPTSDPRAALLAAAALLSPARAAGALDEESAGSDDGAEGSRDAEGSAVLARIHRRVQRLESTGVYDSASEESSADDASLVGRRAALADALAVVSRAVAWRRRV